LRRDDIPAYVGAVGHDTAPVPLERIAWLVTVAIMIVTAVVLFINGYTGYGALALVVGAAAAINLR